MSQITADYDFYKCLRCAYLLTRQEMEHALASNTGSPCPCGAFRFTPVNLRWYQVLYPRVLTFAAHRLRELGLRGLWANRHKVPSWRRWWEII